MSEKAQLERCVADTSILLDLEQTQLLPALLISKVSLITTPEVIRKLGQNDRKEIEQHCQNGQMTIEMATADDMNQVINEVGPINRMSTTDRALCRIAKRLNANLLSGCDYLRRDAEQRGIRAKSLIWVLDRLVRSGLLKPATAVKKLVEVQSRSPWMNKQLTHQQIQYWEKMSKLSEKNYIPMTTNLHSA
ncbi:hypothetical protein [Spirosoma aerophilum]